MFRGIIKRIKRFFFRLKNRDPFYHCPVWKNEGCSHVDGLICDFPSCDIYREYMERKDSNFVSCVACVFNQECCSKQFGLGCNKGKISK
jgi:hypothetical protein